MIILVCGGRDYNDWEKVCKVLGPMKKKITKLVCGAARGADNLVFRWSIENKVPCDLYPANWKLYGRSAGPIRNAVMLKAAKPDLVIAFPGGDGTNNMKMIARKANVKVKSIKAGA